MLASPRTRIIAVVGAVVALLGLLAVVAVLVLTVFSGQEDVAPPPGQAGIGGTTATSTPGGGQVAQATTGAAKDVTPEIPPSFEVFTDNKDPFKPLDVPEEAAADGSADTAAGVTTSSEVAVVTTDASGDSTGTIKPGVNVLYLHAIEEDEGGNRVAIVYWDNEQYEVGEGEQVDDSPWSVVSIGSSSATFLYGDDRVTLRVGEQLGK